MTTSPTTSESSSTKLVSDKIWEEFLERVARNKDLVQYYAWLGDAIVNYASTVYCFARTGLNINFTMLQHRRQNINSNRAMAKICYAQLPVSFQTHKDDTHKAYADLLEAWIGYVSHRLGPTVAFETATNYVTIADNMLHPNRNLGRALEPIDSTRISEAIEHFGDGALIAHLSSSQEPAAEVAAEKPNGT